MLLIGFTGRIGDGKGTLTKMIMKKYPDSKNLRFEDIINEKRFSKIENDNELVDVLLNMKNKDFERMFEIFKSRLHSVNIIIVDDIYLDIQADFITKLGGKIFEIIHDEVNLDKNNFYCIDYGLMMYLDKIIEEIYNNGTQEQLLKNFENSNLNLTFKETMELTDTMISNSQYNWSK